MFDLTNVEATSSMDALPAGEYNVVPEKAEWKTSKTGAQYLNVMFRLKGNEKFDKACIFEMYNLMHSKDQVKQIAMGKLKNLLLAQGCDAAKLNLTSQEAVCEIILSGGPLRVGLGQKTDDYGTKNIIKYYEKIKDESHINKAVAEGAKLF